MERQDIGSQKQGGRDQPKAIAYQSLDQPHKEGDEDRLHFEVSKGGEDRQEQADHRPYLTPERAVGGNVGTATLGRWLGSCR